MISDVVHVLGHALHQLVHPLLEFLLDNVSVNVLDVPIGVEVFLVQQLLR